MLKGLFKSSIIDLDGSGIVTVAANAFGNIDADQDLSLPGSFTKTIKEHFPRLRWLLNHNRDNLIGVPLEAKETNEYLQVRGKLNMKKQIGRDVYEDYKLYAENGLSLEHSVAVDAINFINDRENNVRKVMEWKWWEWSTLTTWGANEKTPMLEMKSLDDLLPDLALLELKIKKGNYKDETFIGIEQSINRIKSLLMRSEEPQQPVSADALADVFKQFTKTLK